MARQAVEMSERTFTLKEREQARSLRIDKLHFEPRPSRADEDAMTAGVRAREDQANEDSVDACLQRVALIASELEALRTSLRERHATTRVVYRDIDTIRRTLTHLRTRIK
jgi:hypothetical protein